MEFLKYQSQKRKFGNSVDKLLAIEGEKVASIPAKKFTPPNEEADFHLLISLLPHLRRVPKQRKLLVRSKLQQVICCMYVCIYGEKLHGEYRAQYRVSGGSSNQSRENGSTIRTPQRTPELEDLASYFSNIIPND